MQEIKIQFKNNGSDKVEIHGLAPYAQQALKNINNKGDAFGSIRACRAVGTASWRIAGTVASALGSATETAFSYGWKGIQWAAPHVWTGAQWAGKTTWSGVKLVTPHVWTGIRWGGEGIQQAAKTSWSGITWLAKHAWNGSKDSSQKGYHTLSKTIGRQRLPGHLDVATVPAEPIYDEVYPESQLVKPLEPLSVKDCNAETGEKLVCAMIQFLVQASAALKPGHVHQAPSDLTSPSQLAKEKHFLSVLTKKLLV